MKKTIFVISYCFPNDKNPQSGCFVLDQCVLLEKAGYNIIVLNVANFNLPNYRINKKEVKEIPVYESATAIKAHSYIPRTTYFIYNYLYGRLFKQAVREIGKPDLIYAHFSYPTGFVAQNLSQKYNIPYAVMEHSSMFFERVPCFVKKRLPGLVEGAKNFMCVSESLQKSIEAILPELSKKIMVVYNAIDSSFDYEPKQADDNVFKFFSAGNLVPIKQFHILIEAIAKLKKEGLHVSLRIAGEGVERPILEKQIKMLGLNNEVKMLGRLNKEEMRKEYIDCSAFVLPSRAETFGIVYREAMFVGRPVICFDNGGINEGWHQDFGIIVKEQTAEALSFDMTLMIEDYNKYNHKKISELSHSLFSPESVSSKLKELL